MPDQSIGPRSIEEIVTDAADGSRAALEEVVLRIQDRVYGLALRMLSHPENARDATQEILIKVITNLKGFRFEGPFMAWVLRIAANHLKTTRKRGMERLEIDWEKAEHYIDQAQARGWLSQAPAAPTPLLEVEMRLKCVQALLTALDRAHRLAFILGAVMEVTCRQGAYIMDITPAAFRKRLSRARSRLKDFLGRNCGLFNESNRCRCSGVLANNLQNGWINPDKLLFAGDDFQEGSNGDLLEYLKEVDELGRLSVIYKAFPSSPCPDDYSKLIKDLVMETEFRVLADHSFH